MSSHAQPTHADKLAELRTHLAQQGLEGFVVPLTDVHLSEYVGEDAKRLHWLTGFKGSAGSAIVLQDSAAIFVDGRYSVQVREQVEGALFAYQNVPETSHSDWLKAHALKGAKIGYDSWLHTINWVKAQSAALASSGIELVAVETNPVDAVWENRPAASASPAQHFPESYAGQSAADKRLAIADGLKAEGADVAIICALDSVAWAFNMRGGDVAHTPVALAFALIDAQAQADLCIAPEKLDAELKAALGNAVRLHPYEAFPGLLASLKGKRVSVDPERCVAAVFNALETAGAVIVEQRDPCILPKACKNPVELAGARQAHLVDAVALTRYLHWLSQEAHKGALTELSASDKLAAFRAEYAGLKDLSFGTISAAGAHAALPHYSASEESNAPLLPNSIYLVDSGGQYLEGTTDVTRTIWLGPDAPPASVKAHFTLVLKGHIALDQAVFPQGTRGSQLDTLARQFLWQAGLDYAHGTGHGVGHYLSVHEGPQRIAKMAGGQSGGEEPLRAGMILSNEPGYYKAGAYGIRIENLVIVEPREIEGAEGDFLGFNAITLAPIDRNLIDYDMLTAQEQAWLSAYHARVRAALADVLEGEARDWLLAVTE
jgi:Xaa-Pro aminopeptidase